MFYTHANLTKGVCFNVYVCARVTMFVYVCMHMPACICLPHALICAFTDALGDAMEDNRDGGTNICVFIFCRFKDL